MIEGLYKAADGLRAVSAQFCQKMRFSHFEDVIIHSCGKVLTINRFLDGDHVSTSARRIRPKTTFQRAVLSRVTMVRPNHTHILEVVNHLKQLSEEIRINILDLIRINIQESTVKKMAATEKVVLNH